MPHPELPGVENEKRIKPLTDAAEEYRRVMRLRMKWGRAEKVEKDKIIELMQKHKLETYHDGDLSVVLTTSESIKVRTAEDDKPEEEEKNGNGKSGDDNKE